MMKTVNIHDAKTHLSKLIEKAVNGEPFIIAKSGKPMVKVIPVDARSDNTVSRTGFMKGALSVPDDFETMGSDTIEKLFGVSE